MRSAVVCKDNCGSEHENNERNVGSILDTTDGMFFVNNPAKYFNTVAGCTVIRAPPVAWLDNDSVLIQVSDDKNEAVLRLDLPNSLVYITSGVLVSLTYP
jgi:hypothetical protein